MNPQFSLLTITFGLLTGGVWFFSLTVLPLWKKRKGLNKEQRLTLYCLRALIVAVILQTAYALILNIRMFMNEQAMAENYTPEVIAIGVSLCALGSGLLLIQRKHKNREYGGKFFIAVGLFTLITNFLIS